MNDQQNQNDLKNIPGVTWNDDGSATIELLRAINVSGDKLKSITMQCPSMKFMRQHNTSIEGMDGEVKGVAELCGLAVEEIDQTGYPDYQRIQKVFACFLVGTAPNWTMPSTPSVS